MPIIDKARIRQELFDKFQIGSVQFPRQGDKQYIRVRGVGMGGAKGHTVQKYLRAMLFPDTSYIGDLTTIYTTSCSSFDRTMRVVEATQ